MPRFSFGFGKAEITAFERGFSMWGWASPNNVATGAATPLFARAVVLGEEDGAPIVFACLDLGMISESLRRSVLAELARRGVDVDEHRLALTATHTHSGPSGFSTYLFYALAGPGFSFHVHDAIVRGTVRAIEEAFARRERGRVFLNAGYVPLSETVAFNRAVASYNKNEDVTPVAEDRSDEAVDRRMTVLRFEDEHGNARGLVSFFAVHGTSVHADCDRLHSDNKGLAATTCERDEGASFVAIFAQEAAGDVSPNYRWDPRRGVLVGRYDDDFESAEHNASIQARHALRLFRAAAREGRELLGEVDARLRYSRFHEVQVDADLADGQERKTTMARLGLGFALGTREGPGWLGGVRDATSGAMLLLGMRSSARADREGMDPHHGRKVPLWDLGPGARNKIGLPPDHPMLALLTDRRFRYYRESARARGVHVLPWVPHHLPFQILRVGDLAIALSPFEPTTQAGRRLRKTVVTALERAGTTTAIACGYSNAYASYLTTPEEYDNQLYEGATTMFGKWSLGAVGTELRRVARDMLAKRAASDVGELPPSVPIEHWLPGARREASTIEEPSTAAATEDRRSVSGFLLRALAPKKREAAR